MARLTKKTQEFVPIKEIRDGVVILNDNTMRMVLMASSLNFALKSEEEQIAIIYQFQNFLNSLDFDTQIFIQSRRLDIRPYLLTLDERFKYETNELIKIQIREYIEFIRNFTETTDVMNKTFFIIIPYASTVFNQKKGFLSVLKKESSSSAEPLDTFAESKTQLEQRMSVIKQGMDQIGIRVVPLGTEELVELYFKIFNPGEIDTPKLEEKPEVVTQP